MSNNETQGTLENGSLDQETEKMIYTYERLMGALYTKAATYTNLIMIGGYAAFFTLWNFTKLYLGVVETLIAALLMIISATIFVFSKSIR